jgi:hypothetical protein
MATIPAPTVTPPAAGFFCISLGDRMLFCGHTQRVSVEAFALELTYWRDMFGDAVDYHIQEIGNDLAATSIALAIFNLHPTGLGVSPQLLIDLGYRKEVVEAHFAEALAAVKHAASTSATPGANVVRFRPRPNTRHTAPSTPGAA